MPEEKLGFCMKNDIVFGKIYLFFGGRLWTADAEAESRLTYSSLLFTGQPWPPQNNYIALSICQQYFLEDETAKIKNESMASTTE